MPDCPCPNCITRRDAGQTVVVYGDSFSDISRRVRAREAKMVEKALREEPTFSQFSSSYGLASGSALDSQSLDRDLAGALADELLRVKAGQATAVDSAITDAMKSLAEASARLAAERERCERRRAFEMLQREDYRIGAPSHDLLLSVLTFNQRRASEEWSADLREKVKASSAAAAERERAQVVDLDW